MKIEKIMDKIVKILGLLLFCWIIVLLVFFESKINYSTKREFLISNIIITIIGLIFIFLYKKKILKIPNINYDKIIKRTILIFFLIQLYIFYNIYFETGWDPSHVYGEARSIVAKKGINNLAYYSVYPNNIFITLFYYVVLKINSYIGIFPGSFDLMSIIVINCTISSYCSYLVYKIGKKLFDKKIAFLGYIASVILFVFSPWNVICYSDSLAILFPILIFDIYLNKKMNNYFKYQLIFTLGYISYLIKPQAIIILIAIMIIEIFKLIININKEKIKNSLIILIISLIPILMIMIAFKQIEITKFKINKEEKLGITHFLMMGTNSETNGVYSEEDVRLSISIPSKKERINKNLEIYKKRIKKYGVNGYFNLLSKKILTAYNDGSYAWLMEGDFLYRLKPDINKNAKHLKSIYYGKNYIYYSTFLQFVWINTLLLCFFTSIIVLKNKEKIDYNYLILILTIIGATLFQLLFEVRARYLYVNVPIYIILMMYSLNNLKKTIYK